MRDDVYAAALLAILTNRHPSGIDPADPYGQADDGIDRYNSFGRDVQIEAVQVVEGDHGAEFEVRFVLALPDDLTARGMPERGRVRVPADEEWRELSGYREPAAYAPRVAREVERAARRMVEAHESRRGRPAASVPAPPGTHWEALVAGLAGHGVPVEVVVGRIELRHTSGSITLLVTPEEWEHVVANHAGTDIEMYLDELLAPRQEDELFVVFFDGDLTLSTREELPPVRGQANANRVAAIRADNPTAEFGWFAHTPSPRQQPD